MNYKTLLFTLLIGFTLFFLIVTLGIKYDWGRYFQAEVAEESAEQSGRLPEQPTMQDPAQTLADETKPENKPVSAENFELVEEKYLTNDVEEQIRNDCIRASRRAGVGDDRIFEVVNQCVEMSRQSTPEIAPPADTDFEGAPVQLEMGTAPEPLVVEENDGELTRRACEIVADQDPKLDSAAREKIIEECIRNNQ